ncbi:DUF4190 domain-containing protein [Clostridium bovifaecis]|uniref:DUF4190 domain-containing protein n=1 Tax=Clostridium bovifaecis TaxID=2184719 RepID=A0A6I6F301_9CLOT|nr:DUF4190 domain-containing protein [Clostridium bovifaecis]
MKNDGLSIASMILGIIGLVFTFVPGLNFLGILCGILAIIFGIIGKNKIANSNGELSGTGMAKAGLILGVIIVALFVLTLIACGALISTIS